jgi:flagellum-specific peptidoglycan hydrolase FlgJ
MTPERLQAIAKIAEAAVCAEAKSGVPAELTAAQCILESGWLKSAPGNNPFGIKATDRHAEIQVLTTTEVFKSETALLSWIRGRSVRQLIERLPSQPGEIRVRVKDAFAKYATLADAFEDHQRLIKNGRPYAKAWAGYQIDRDLVKFVRAIAPIYATDPAYAGKLERIISTPELAAAIAEQRRKRAAHA